MLLYLKEIFLKKERGSMLIEAIVGLAVFLIIAISAYQGYMQTIEVIRASRFKVVAINLANEQLEIVRNLPYTDVGTTSGLPPGKVPANQTLVRDEITFSVKTTIRNIDDPFDGLIGGAPNDLSPADYKLVEIEIACPACKNFQTFQSTTHVSPKNLETASENGALFIQVFDANGQPVSGANVHLENNQAVPAIVIDDVSNNGGLLAVVDAPPGIEAYEITVTKSGYSTDKTYPSGVPENPNPTKPHATVVLQQVTQISFTIDRLSTIIVSSETETCQTIGEADFSLQGYKLIGTEPNIYKYEQSHVTEASGQKTISDLEWDTYNFSLTDAIYDLKGSIPLFPLNLIPNTTQNLQLILTEKNPSSLLVTVKDVGTDLPLSDSSVKMEKVGFDETLITGRGYLRQTDWSGGGGQADFVDLTKYFEGDGNLEIANPAGELRLWENLGQYAPSGTLTSSTFDTGSESNFFQILWQPLDQPPETGIDGIRFQIATNNDNATWNFLGPDVTADTFYTLADTNINAVHNNNRYLRYKVFLQTADPLFTPNLSEVAITFSSLCVPPGQVLFTGLSADTYDLTVTRAGYQEYFDTIIIAADWQQQEIGLTPS